METYEIPIYQHIARQALEQYELGAVQLQVHLLTFVNNATFKVTVQHSDNTSQSFALRIHRPGEKSLEHIHAEIQWLLALQQDTQLKTPHPIFTLAGTPVGVAKDASSPELISYVLFAWLDGHFTPTSAQTATHAEQVGRFIGLLHQHSHTFSPTHHLTRRHLDSNGLFDWEALYRLKQSQVGFTENDFALCTVVAERTDAIFQMLGRTSDVFGLIHADLIWKNYFFHNHGVGAVDFDDCGWGYYLYDLAPTLLGYRDEPRYPTLRAGLLAGYRSVCPLPIQYERYLDTLIAARHVRSCCWLARRLTDQDIRHRAEQIIRHRIIEISHLLGM